MFDNFREWHFQHLPPNKDCEDMEFILSNSDPQTEEFVINNLESDLRISYNVKTHLQIIQIKKLKNLNYNEIIE